MLDIVIHYSYVWNLSQAAATATYLRLSNTYITSIQPSRHMDYSLQNRRIDISLAPLRPIIRSTLGQRRQAFRRIVHALQHIIVYIYFIEYV
jgi:hypothetical protein